MEERYYAPYGEIISEKNIGFDRFIVPVFE